MPAMPVKKKRPFLGVSPKSFGAVEEERVDRDTEGIRL